MSVSYGNDESQQKSVAYMQQCNQQFMKIGAIGVSVLFAAGDQGVLGRSGPGKVYHPDFPAASPYVTAVGGTDFVTKGAIGPEKVWSAGGGGFSNTFPIPQYQATAVAGYMKSAGTALLPPAAKWNSTGRAYPDVSALGGQGTLLWRIMIIHTTHVCARTHARARAHTHTSRISAGVRLLRLSPHLE